MNTVRERNAFASADNRTGMSAMPASPGTTSGRMTAPHGVGGRAERAFGVISIGEVHITDNAINFFNNEKFYCVKT